MDFLVLTGSESADEEARETEISLFTRLSHPYKVRSCRLFVDYKSANNDQISHDTKDHWPKIKKKKLPTTLEALSR